MKGRAFLCVPQEISLSLEPANDDIVGTGTVPYLMLYRSMDKLKECTSTGAHRYPGSFSTRSRHGHRRCSRRDSIYHGTQHMWE